MRLKLKRLIATTAAQGHLEFHLVGALALSKSELGLEVRLEERVFREGRQDGGIDGFLVGLLLVCQDLSGGGGLVKELGVGRGGGLCRTLEVRIVKLGCVDGSNIDCGAGRDNVSLVDTTQGDAVDAEGAGNKKQTRRELLQEDDAHAAVHSCEQDENRAGLDRLAQLRRVVDVLARRHRQLNIVRGVPLGALGDGHSALLAILVTADRLGDGLNYGLVLLRARADFERCGDQITSAK
jgi:hypothetical protein